MMDFFDGMSTLQQSFWWVAIIASLIFLLQLIFTIIGTDLSDGLGADFDGNLDAVHGPFQLFSFRNLINFLMGFGWTGVAFFHSIQNQMFLIILAALVGILFVVIFFVVIKQILKLTEDNTFNINKLIGKTAEVYLRIPEARSGNGKIQVSLNGTNHELLAITETGEIASGSLVRIIRVEEKVLIVEKI
ncbi:serine protease [Epilithonimonas sp. JDS]|uniref:NfeD family protein n=1 Tax=Epilithonimonas sp. JDS TaxID=2902797 RepID=UPI001E557856|nr:NfeD family protein [Epilithonimonas sp. JDS]MCD9856042.1 serine protease [Epilithonimonas sp. JDS]